MHDKDSFVPPATSSQDPIAAISATEQCFLVARESGVVQRYSLPHLSMETRFQIRCRPQVIAVNCDSTRMSVIDINGMLTLYDVEVKASSGPGGDNRKAEGESQVGAQLEFE